MVDVITKKCAAPGGCPKQPSFGVAGSRKAEYCAKHSAPGMICLRTSKAKKDYANGKRRADDGSDMDDMDGRRTRRKSAGTSNAAPMDWSALQSAAAAAYISKMVPLPMQAPPPPPQQQPPPQAPMPPAPPQQQQHAAPVAAPLPPAQAQAPPTSAPPPLQVTDGFSEMRS